MKEGKGREETGEERKAGKEVSANGTKRKAFRANDRTYRYIDIDIYIYRYIDI